MELPYIFFTIVIATLILIAILIYLKKYRLLLWGVVGNFVLQSAVLSVSLFLFDSFSAYIDFLRQILDIMSYLVMSLALVCTGSFLMQLFKRQKNSKYTLVLLTLFISQLLSWSSLSMLTESVGGPQESVMNIPVAPAINQWWWKYISVWEWKAVGLYLCYFCTVLGILNAVAFFGDTVAQSVSFRPFAANAGNLSGVDED